MEKLTIKELEDYMKTPLTNLRGGKEFQLRMVSELYKYKQLEEQIGCPLEVRFNIYEGQHIFYEDGNEYIIHQIGKYDFYMFKIVPPYTQLIGYIKGYRKSWWLKKDKSE